MRSIEDRLYATAKAYDEHWRTVMTERNALADSVLSVKRPASAKWQAFCVQLEENTRQGDEANRQRLSALAGLYAAYGKEHPQLTHAQTCYQLNRQLGRVAEENGFTAPPNNEFYSVNEIPKRPRPVQGRQPRF